MPQKQPPASTAVSTSTTSATAADAAAEDDRALPGPGRRLRISAIDIDATIAELDGFIAAASKDAD